MTSPLTNTLTELFALAKRMPDQLTESDKMALSDLYQHSLEHLDEPEDLFAYTIARAMRKHVTGEQSAEHIYLQRFDIPQIRLFELLIQQFPLANLSQQCTNTLLIDALSNHQRPVLMDIGVGTGMQVAHILAGLAHKADRSIQHLTVVGIEPYTDALESAGQHIAGAALQLPFPVTFVSRAAFIEQLSVQELQQLLPDSYDGLYVNASFALHHIQHASQRKDVFANLKALPISALVLSEPNSDHYEPNYAKRFTNCVHHYGALFQLIDQLAITNTEKTALKLFFSREIDDVLGNAEATRVEKHYATQQWEQLFAETGFTLTKRPATFPTIELNGAQLKTDLPNRYAAVFESEEITSLFWAHA